MKDAVVVFNSGFGLQGVFPSSLELAGNLVMWLAQVVQNRTQLYQSVDHDGVCFI